MTTLIQFMYAAADDDCCCCEPECCEGDGEFFDEDDFVVLTDTETGEEYSFILVDNFDFEDATYFVMMVREVIYVYLVSLLIFKLVV